LLGPLCELHGAPAGLRHGNTEHPHRQSRADRAFGALVYSAAVSPGGSASGVGAGFDGTSGSTSTAARGGGASIASTSWTIAIGALSPGRCRASFTMRV